MNITKTEWILSMLLAVAIAMIVVQWERQDQQRRDAYKQGVQFGHRCVNASVANSNGKVWAAESFRLQSIEFAKYDWVCRPSESLLVQEAVK